MTCEELAFRPAAHAAMAASVDSCKSAWTEKRRRRRVQQSRSPPPTPSSEELSPPVQHQVISAGMLPTLQALGSLSCETQQRGVCLVPIADRADAAKHMQTTLLEAYCREIGLPLLRLPVPRLRSSFPELRDLSCVLVVGDPADFFLESPE